MKNEAQKIKELVNRAYELREKYESGDYDPDILLFELDQLREEFKRAFRKNAASISQMDLSFFTLSGLSPN